ncbi:Uncharacterized membrane protein, DUF441 family [Pasteurella testudinis DSM 23072]|uniref:UPF0756 membrane protein SAMN05660772_00431 n=1 Tax=Pasteurella testudinis DSM 23072 TaxID=1122938 RepID=A0A1W1UET9_9PAST|nr:DUF441 domain-containing protein [Pasteurella testudinis]SMB79597.1 Uncharacterized membrane protein, DUF441 family [Pasteurella testudinis DSM 23072]SUB50707.1 membrane protein [Pasteurella testudinis]
MSFFHFNTAALILVFLIILGYFSHNNSIIFSAAVLLVMQQSPLESYIPWLEKYGLHIGITILTIGVLSPLVSGKIKLDNPAILLLNWKMILAIVVGIFVAWLGGRGLTLMTASPSIITGLLIGTIAGVAFFKGVPVGPLIAAGMLSLIVSKL